MSPMRTAFGSMARMLRGWAASKALDVAYKLVPAQWGATKQAVAESHLTMLNQDFTHEISVLAEAREALR